MDQNGKDDLKTQFMTREGTYRLITLSEYSRPNRVGYQSNQNNPQVRVSLITLPAADVVASTATISATPSMGNALTATTTTTTTSAVSNAIAENAKYQTHQSSSATTTNAAISLNGTVDASLLNSTQQSQQAQQQQQQQTQQGVSDRICFNFGKELYVYSYRGVKKVSTICYRRLESPAHQQSEFEKLTHFLYNPISEC